MPNRYEDGSAGDINYGVLATGYINYRQPEPAIMQLIEQALGSAAKVLNVGAGTGSYEPLDREITPVEPSASMRAQRPAHLARAIDGTAEDLPFPNGYFDASLATYTIHQWPDQAAGLREMRRVTSGPVIILCCDPAHIQDYWLHDYAPEVLARESRRFPSLSLIEEALGGTVEVWPVEIPLNCRDGFNEAYYGRPEMFLDDQRRFACSAWSLIEPALVAGYLAHLRADLDSGDWDAQYGQLRTRPHYEGSLRLVVGRL
jgi:SAM-dependent methyltransferase